MKPTDPREPSRDELLAMAYVDGELAAGDIETFEHRLATDPALAREVAELQKLGILARQVAPPEPMDFEWQRLQNDVVHSTGWSLGWILTCIGTLGLGVIAAIGVLFSELGTGLKFFLFVTTLGLSTLFLLVLRARLRTLPLDPYTEVKR